MQHALVTGGCGFLGSSVVKELRERGVRVRVLALPDERTDNLDGVEVEVVRGDVLAPADCGAAVAGCDTVFHLAAVYKAWMPDPSPMYRVNLSGTFNVLEAARRAGVSKVVYTASVVSLGRPGPGRVADERTPYEAFDLDFPYSRSKWLSRELAEDFGRWGLDVRVVCPGIVLGPGDLGPTPSGKLILEALSGAPPVYCDGAGTYVDVRDAAMVHVLAAERGRPGERYLATAHDLDNHAFLAAIGEAGGQPRRLRKVPLFVARAAASAMELAAKRRGGEPKLARDFLEYAAKPMRYSNAKSVTELGATYRSFDVTLRDAIAWFRARGMLPSAG